MQAPNNTTTSGNSGAIINQTISPQERASVIENIKKFLFEHLPAEQVSSPQKAHELAVRFETHVAFSTSTKDQYQRMISDKLRMIKQKSVDGSSSLNISPEEIAQISARLLQIKPQIPQIDKLLQLHAKLPVAASNSAEMVKKLTDCRNVLFSQLELATSSSSKSGNNNFIMNLSQLNLLIEQVQKLFNSLVAKMKESAGVSPSITATTATSASAFSTNSNSALTSSSYSSSSTVASSASLSTSHKRTKSTSNTQQHLQASSHEKLLIQRLSLPDKLEESTSSSKSPSWMANFIQIQSLQQRKGFTSAKHLKFRNKFVEKELKALQQQFGVKRVKVQENEFGYLSIILLLQKSSPERFIFQLSPRYPFDNLIYRIESTSSCVNNTNDNNNFRTLPSKFEPKTLPLTLTNILRNYEYFISSNEK